MRARACLGLALGLFLAVASGRADDGKAIRLELKGGEVLAGRLDGFAARTYRVRLTDGKVREVREDEVTRVEFPGQAPGARPTACQRTGEALARAAASGALAERVLGTHRFLVTQRRHDLDEKVGTARAPQQTMLVANIAREGNELLLDLEALYAPGERSDPEVLDLDAGRPFRFRARVGLDGRLVRAEAFGSPLRGTWTVEGPRYQLEFSVGGRSGKREWAWSDEMLLEPFVGLVLAPLHDAGLASPLPFRMVRPKGPDGPDTLRRLTALPGVRTVAGEQVRALEIFTERGGKPAEGEDAIRLFVGAAGPRKGQLVRWEQDGHGFSNEVRYVTESMVMERIDAGRFEALLDEWKPERAPAEPPPALPPAPAAPAPPDPVASFLKQARRSGLLARAAGRRCYMLRVPRKAEDPLEGLVILVETRVQVDEQRLELEVEEQVPGDPERSHLYRVSWDAEGRLIEHSALTREPGGQREERARPLGAELKTLVVQRSAPLEGWPGSERKREGSDRLEPGTVAEQALTWLFPLLADALPARLEMRGRALPSALGRGLLLEPLPLAEGARELAVTTERERGNFPARAGSDYFAVPVEWAPTRAVLLSSNRDGVRGRPAWVAWLDGKGALLGLSLGEAGARSFGPGLEVLPIPAISEEQAAALRTDPAALAAGARRRRQFGERDACLALDALHRAQETHRQSDLDHDGEPDFAAAISELAGVGLLEQSGALAIGRTHFYRFELRRAADAPTERWVAVANPLEAGWRSFAITHEGMVLVGDGPLAAATDGRAPAGTTPHQGW